MPVYTFVCSKCYKSEERVLPMADASEPQFCECGYQMRRDFQADIFNPGNKEYGKSLVSDSLAISPEQISEHQKLFPDVKVLPDGRPVFENYKQHDNYLKKTGFRKKRQKVKPRGKRIA
jgi:hypothetical protein